MRFHARRHELRQRRYPLLSFFDLTLNVALCSGVFALGCAILGVILTHNAPRILAELATFAGKALS